MACGFQPAVISSLRPGRGWDGGGRGSSHTPACGNFSLPLGIPRIWGAIQNLSGGNHGSVGAGEVCSWVGSTGVGGTEAAATGVAAGAGDRRRSLRKAVPARRCEGPRPGWQRGREACRARSHLSRSESHMPLALGARRRGSSARVPRDGSVLSVPGCLLWGELKLNSRQRWQVARRNAFI